MFGLFNHRKEEGVVVERVTARAGEEAERERLSVKHTRDRVGEGVGEGLRRSERDGCVVKEVECGRLKDGANGGG